MKKALALLLMLTPATASAHMIDEWDESFAGIRTLHRYGIDEQGVRQSYYVAIIDLTHPDVSVEVALNEDTWGGAKEPVRAMADRHGATIAVNGDYWAWGLNDPSQGTTAVDGMCYRAHPERSAIAFDATLGRVEIGRWGTWPIPDPPPDDCPSWFQHAIGAGPQFIFDGATRWEETPNASDPSVPDINGDTFFGAEAWAWDDGRQPNTAVAVTADGGTMILMTCDGRGAGGAGGCRMASDVAGLLLELGAHQGLKLDSGGSTTFYRDGHVLNHVSDNASTAPRERSVADALLVHSRRVREGCGLALRGETLVIDDGSFCFVRTGRFFFPIEMGNRGLAFFTWAGEGDRDSWARWEFAVEIPGTYRVAAYIPDAGLSTARARYFVGDEAVTLDQDAAAGDWLDLGEHDFGVTDLTSVRLEDNTGEPFLGTGDPGNRRVVFDAIRITPVEAMIPDAGAADAGAADAGAGPDAGVVDAGGPTDPPSDGCGCRVAATPGSVPWLAIGALVLARRRRKGRAPRR